MAPLKHSLTRTVAPTLEPVTTAELRTHLGASTSHNTYIDTLIQTAREKWETDTNRAVLSQTWQLKLDSFPVKDDHIELKKPDLIGVSSVQYTNTTGGTSTFASTGYEVDTARKPGVIFLKSGGNWPTDVQDGRNKVTVTFTAGYGTTRTDVPATDKQAIKLLVDDWFNHRSIDGPSNMENYMALVYERRWGDYR